MNLEEATRALREEGAMDAAQKRALRERVLGAPRKRTTRAVRWIMPLAAVLAAASVWAAVAREHRLSTPTAAPPVATMTTTTTPPVAPVASVPSVSDTTSATASAVPPTTIAPVDVASVHAVTVKAPTPDDSERRALRAYRDAERLQFDDKDYARALDAWDRYIPLAGRSPLLVDARWQRALCLVKLGRRDEARAALEPFARGELGAYRRDEAQSLLDTLQ